MDGWTPEVVIALVVGGFGGVLALLSLVLQYVVWRSGGPLVRVRVHPAVVVGPGRAFVGMTSNEFPEGKDAVAVSIFSTGRQPVYVDTVVFCAVPRFRVRLWRMLSMQRLRSRLGLVREGRGEVRLIPTEGLYIGDARPGRIDAAARCDLLFRADKLTELEARARADGHPGSFTARLSLGSGRIASSDAYWMSRPPRPALIDVKVDREPVRSSG